MPWTALVPFADCLNHTNVQTKYDYDVEANQTFRLFPTGHNLYLLLSLHLVTFHRYRQGTEVFNSYGRRANDNLLLDYGFALPENEWEEVDIYNSSRSLFQTGDLPLENPNDRPDRLPAVANKSIASFRSSPSNYFASTKSPTLGSISLLSPRVSNCRQNFPYFRIASLTESELDTLSSDSWETKVANFPSPLLSPSPSIPLLYSIHLSNLSRLRMRRMQSRSSSPKSANSTGSMPPLRKKTPRNSLPSLLLSVIRMRISIGI